MLRALTASPFSIFYIMSKLVTNQQLSNITFLDVMIAISNGSESKLFANNDVEPLNTTCYAN